MDYESPWGKNPKQKNPEDLFQSGKDFFKKFSSNNSGPSDKNIFLLFLGVFILGWLLSGFYMVNEGEQAAVLRFGKYVRVGLPGANYRLPFPFEEEIKVPVDRIQKAEIGFRSNGSAEKSFSKDKSLHEESLMLTGDENVLDINFFVQWRVSNIQSYLFNVKNIQDTVKGAAESAMRQVVGNTKMAVAQTEGRALVEQQAKDLLQKILDGYKSGVIIENLHLLKVDPPAEVVDAFRDVQTARADKERIINQAEAYRNDILPKARGDAEKLIQDSEGYKKQAINKAMGDAESFNRIYAEYAKAQDVTKKRMYLETMEKIMADAEKVILSNDAGRSVLPHISLNEKAKG